MPLSSKNNVSRDKKNHPRVSNAYAISGGGVVDAKIRSTVSRVGRNLSSLGASPGGAGGGGTGADSEYEDETYLTSDQIKEALSSGKFFSLI